MAKLIVILACLLLLGALLSVDAHQHHGGAHHRAHHRFDHSQREHLQRPGHRDGADRPAINVDLIEHHNSLESTWKAGVNEVFVGKSIRDIQRLLGWIPQDPEKLKGFPRKSDLKYFASLPTNFTASENWPNCPTIGTIYNQAECGSCWAFGAVESASDRLCIASNGQFTQILSFEEMVSCGPCNGCDGGDAYEAWSFIKKSSLSSKHGLVTDECYPYTVPTCPPEQQPCLNFVRTPACRHNNTCNNGDSFASEKHYATEVYAISSKVEDIQQEIMAHGPVEACFTVYEDFVNYKSGVYRHESGSALGGHCVKISGWGEENGIPYWLVNNSWTTAWGDGGYFKILRGKDECGIEDDVVAGLMAWSN